MDRGKLQVKIDGEWKELVKIEEVDYKNYEWVENKTYAKEPLRSSGEVKGTAKSKEILMDSVNNKNET